MKPQPPSPSCAVCQVHRVILTSNLYSFRLRNILTDVIQDELQSRYALFEAGDEQTVVITHGQRIIYDAIDEITSLADKTLTEIGIKSGDYLRLEFEDKSVAVQVAIVHDDSFEEEDYQVEVHPLSPEQLEAISQLQEAAAAAEEGEPASKQARLEEQEEAVSSDDDLQLIE